MTGNFHIDGQDAYSLYRVFVTDNGYNDLVGFHALKAVESNDWAEADGVEVDLSAPVLDTRELSVGFAFHGQNARFGAFIEQLSDGAYHDFDFTEIGKTYRLRLVSQPGMSQITTLGVFSLRFADDFPLWRYEYIAPRSNIVPKQDYGLDARNLSVYGVYVLQGSNSEIQRSPDVKKNLLQNFKSQIGAIYDGAVVVFQAKEVKLDCLMRAETLIEFWCNYNALLYDLVRPNGRILSVYSSGYKYPCYYKSCSVSNFSPNGKIWLQFSLVLTFTNFRIVAPPLPDPIPAPTLTLSTSIIALNAEGDEDSITATANTEWRVEQDESKQATIAWGDGTSDNFTISYTGDEGVSLLSIISDQNLTELQRTVVVTMNSANDNEPLAILTVIQNVKTSAYSKGYSSAYD